MSNTNLATTQAATKQIGTTPMALDKVMLLENNSAAKNSQAEQIRGLPYNALTELNVVEESLLLLAQSLRMLCNVFCSPLTRFRDVHIDQVRRTPLEEDIVH